MKRSTSNPQRVILFSGHYLGSRRRAGFHFLAEAYHQMGWDVTFVTVSLSWLSSLRRDHRMQYPVRAEAGHAQEIAPGLRSFVYLTPYHPANLRHPLLNRLSAPVFARYGSRFPRVLESLVLQADLIVFESTPGLLMVPRCRELNPRARYVYRVSDDLRVLANHPVVIEAEAAHSACFDLVSVPSANMTRLFADHPRLRVQPHGLDLTSMDAPSPNPYSSTNPNVVFVGNSRFDHDFLRRALDLFPDWEFHIIGPILNLPTAPNLTSYGEIPFRETLPYVRHANAGLQTLEYSPGAESFSDSLKVLQYTYCGLGIVAPEFLRSSRANVFYYRPGDDDSIAAALQAAVALDPAAVDRSGIYTWRQLATELAA